MLTSDEQALLEDFLARNDANAPYWRRVNIILMSDAGVSPEDIAIELGSSIVQTRKWINVYRREGIAIFPDSILRAPALFSADEHIAEAGRAFLREQLAIIERYAGALEEEGDPTAVHETRKAIRRMQIVFALLTPYFEEGTFNRYRRRFRKVARRIGPARDTYVFLDKLTMFLDEAVPGPASRAGLESLREYWQGQLKLAAAQAQKAALKRGYRTALTSFSRLVHEEGAGVPAPGVRAQPLKVRHLAPIFIMDQLARVLAYDEVVPEASATQLHRLRIRFKWLRYTLDFLTPILGNEVLTLTGELNGIQDHLGDFQDARVAVDMLDHTPLSDDRDVAVSAYRRVRQAESDRLLDTFGSVWGQFDNHHWRRMLYASMSQL